MVLQEILSQDDFFSCLKIFIKIVIFFVKTKAHILVT